MPGKGCVRASSADVLDELERELCRAIRERRLVEFVYDGCRRIAEPHDYGIIDGERRPGHHIRWGALVASVSEEDRRRR